MKSPFSRTQMLLGSQAMDKLKNARVAVFGIGGVGGYVCEALARSGVGSFTLTDSDTVDITNINRQIIATHKTLGLYKVDVMKDRILDINPEAKVTVNKCFFLPEKADDFDFSTFTYVVDAVDTVAAKIALVLKAQSLGIPVISCMGAGNKLDASKFKIADIYKTQVCPLARVMRQELKKRGVKNLKVLYSDEKPIKAEGSETLHGGKVSPGSTAFVPSVAGLLIAGEIVRDISGI